jgi:hypothetical protein
MTKLLFVFLSLGLIFQSAIASDVLVAAAKCSGNVLFEGAYVDLFCTSGYCTGAFPPQDIQIEGRCDSDINYIGNGTIASFLVSGVCKGGLITSSFLSQNIALYGDCLFEDNFYGSFYSSVYSPFGIASGYCQENGMTRIFFNGGVRAITGQCR